MPSPTRRVREQYDELAGRYDARWKRYLTGSINETLARLDPSPHDRVLDAGCGTGLLLAQLAALPIPLSLAGLDVSPGMVRVARRRLPHEVHVVTGDVTVMPFVDASFDVIVSSSAFHYWPDHLAALREVRRLLAPSGRVVITDWCRDYLTCAVLDVVLRRVDPAHCRTWGTGELRDVLHASGFSITRLDPYRISWLWGLMTVDATRDPD